MAHVEDRWMKAGPNGRKIKTDRYGSGKRWRAVWTDGDGTRRRQSCTTRDEAEAVLADVRVAQLTGSYIAPERGKILFADYAELWFSDQIHQRQTSREAIRNRLDKSIIPALGHRTLDQIDRAAIQAAIKTMGESLAPGTVATAYKYIASIFRSAVEDKRIAESPCRRIKLPPPTTTAIVPLTIEQVQTIIETLWKPYRRPAALISVTGIRGGEARGLTWDRVRDKPHGGASITIDRQLIDAGPTWGPPKTPTSVRTISIGPNARAALGPRGHGLVFTSNVEKPLRRANMSEAWRRVASTLALPPGSGFHDLRDFHASQLIAGGASPVAVAARLGHKNPYETLRTYAHLWHDDEDRMVAATDGVVGLPAP